MLKWVQSGTQRDYGNHSNDRSDARGGGGRAGSGVTSKELILVLLHLCTSLKCNTMSSVRVVFMIMITFVH